MEGVVGPGSTVDCWNAWQHTVRLVDVLRRDFTARYPRCVGGERACPPEDCAEMYRFAEILRDLADDTLDDDLRAWLPQGYDPARFDPAAVRFSDPARRLAYSWYGNAEAGDDPFGG
ncbi:IS1096 element passenger TnpR family protein [Candidatus Chloroploca mongolica]|uniref:IS1096 element passenger TnpR family protein n=1 Tax=Candidatus Chloroploca mongolica TaxID=2528176 RepID=UPI001082095B|nr:hypothetical protein [Candidatus Chloroploca mongolica]